NELGLRIALGASRRDVIHDALGSTIGALAIGLAAGALAAAVRLSGSLVAGLLFGLDATDGLNLVSAVLLLVAAGVVACLVPATRALRISPLAAIRIARTDN
ncbi:MAG TPA: hypothetical protein VFO31_03935, partial [Vicinamibacterales bacterium]|nr:hypothetical protein [Vicinamibacterales bacterium]